MRWETIEEIKQLKKGIMTNKELADWFRIKEKSFRDTRAKKLEILKEYAEFENLRGKVNILKIKKPIYTKGSENYKLIKEKTIEQWSSTGLDTCKLVAEKIKKNYKAKLTVSDTTLYSYTCNSKRELWGKAFGEGEIGYCVYELCMEDGADVGVLADVLDQPREHLLEVGARGGQRRAHPVRHVLDYLRLEPVQQVRGVGVVGVEGGAVYPRALADLGHRDLRDGLCAQQLQQAVANHHFCIAHTRILFLFRHVLPLKIKIFVYSYTILPKTFNILQIL